MTLQIDIANPDDIRRKLPEARALYEKKRRDFDLLRAELEGLKHLIESLTVMAQRPIAGARPATGAMPPASANGKAPARGAAIEALRRAGRPMGPAELYRFMQEQDMPVPTNPNALGATLWTAAKAGAIDKIDRRYFAHRVVDYSKLPMDTPFPVPAQPELPPDEGDQK